jgi:hypothetical protein
MALSISQIVAVSYPAVLAEMRKAQNQWVENAAVRELERQGMIKHINFGESIEMPLDYRANPDGGVLATDMDSAALNKTDVITAATYDVAQISYPVTWSKGDDAKNPTETQKVSLVKQLLENGINSHDDLIEQCIFTTSAAGGVELNGLDTLVPTSGQGTPGGIDAGTELFWRNFADTYTDVTDIEATMTAAFNAAMKGSGSEQTPKVILSGADPHALYESQLQSLQRFVDTKEGDGGFKILAFKTARCVFSQYGDDKMYFLNPKSYKLLVSKSYFRDKGTTQELNDTNAFRFFIYSALQAVTDNKSRLAVISL